MPQLDALRTFAVALVIIYHWFPTGTGINWLPNGTIGVMVFFVISGFLITRILLTNRASIQAGTSTLGNTYRNFFIRRALRIFPLYYLVITAVWLLIPEASDIDERPLYYYLYGYNILLHQTGNWADLLSPFWTLGVEEQLYLVWPWVVLLLPSRRLVGVIAGMVAAGILFRAYGYSQGDLDGVLTPANLDSFGLGALWAWVTMQATDQIARFRSVLNGAAGVALVLMGVLLFLPDDHIAVVLFERFIISVLALYLVVGASFGFKGGVGSVLDNGALQYIGRISYGLYVFHMIVPGYIVPFVLRVMNRLLRGHVPDLGYWGHRAFSLAVLIAVASVSWYAFEKPINSLKQYFSYKNTPTDRRREHPTE
ncbi:acyltransferase family protein [Rudanella paleaurantiibacter]|uniref:Acyltransferase family protein n=1 Tax=Rudanella paleaurantiibacter TaxID=2614655 RepID=A0A7J5TYY8_9BACT|nr:acyltransferase [Rudanella paleaurantiibacter]KAB7730167.1 acyltransferase family protein [Rudanella paleaurantiibacter]